MAVSTVLFIINFVIMAIIQLFKEESNLESQNKAMGVGKPLRISLAAGLVAFTAHSKESLHDLTKSNFDS